MPRLSSRLIASALAAVAIATSATTAGATTIRAGATQFLVTGDPGEVNDITFRFDLDRMTVRVVDRVRLNTTIAGGGPCSTSDPREVECPWPAGDSFRRFAIDLGDRNDRLRIDAPRGLDPEFFAGDALYTEVRDGPGDDRASSVPTLTKYVNGPGNDVLRGAAQATAGGGNDSITGTEGPDLLLGGAGRDVIHGALGADVIRGGPSADRLFGDSGQDRLFGGTGNDFLRGGTARDLLNGGPGRDVQIQG
jgi:Ca2+-binding RTX toxin-like protein